MLYLTKQMTYLEAPNRSNKKPKKFIDMIQSKLNTPILTRTGGKKSILRMPLIYCELRA